MNAIAPRHDELVRDQKRRLLGGLSGTVVEVGPGTGINLQYLDPSVRYIAVEPNVHMQRYLRAAAAKLGLDIDVRTGTAEHLPLESSSSDVVISTLVLCSVDHLRGALAEIRRVLKPGGRFVFVEHVAANRGSRLWRWQRFIKPLWRRLGDGCEPDRDIAAAIRSCGFASVQIESFDVSVPVPIVRPHIAGSATR